jgi:hypothetical protein
LINAKYSKVIFTPKLIPLGFALRRVASRELKEHQKLTSYVPLQPNTIWDNPGLLYSKAMILGARPKRIRVGRGPGSGKGLEFN